MKTRIAYFKWRNGRPRWEPGPGLRAKKWKGRDLKDAAGAWLTYGAAIDAAIALNAEVAAWRAAGNKPRRPPARKVARSCRDLFELWIASPQFLKRAPATRSDYIAKVEILLSMRIDQRDRQRPRRDRAATVAWLRRLLARFDLSPTALAARAGIAQSTLTQFLNNPNAPLPGARTIAKLAALAGEDSAPRSTFGDAPVAAVEPSALYGAWEELVEDRGHATANGVIRNASVMFSYGRRKGWRQDNPASKLGMESVPPRLAFWLPAHVAAFVAKADELGYHSLGDAVVVALHSGQRQADVLVMPERLFDDRAIKLSQLRVKIRQRKTRALIDAPMTPALRARIAALKERRRAGGAQGGDLQGEGGHNVVDLNAPLIRREDTDSPHDRNSLGRLFREVRGLLAAERDAAGDPAHPGIGELQFLDLRDTAVTRLALADCTLPQIAAITGHSLQSITDIMKHYLVLQPQMADEAIAKLTAWLEKERIEL